MKDNSQINLSLVKKEYILSLFVEEIKENHDIEEYIQNMDYKTQLALLKLKNNTKTYKIMPAKFKDPSK